MGQYSYNGRTYSTPDKPSTPSGVSSGVRSSTGSGISAGSGLSAAGGATKQGLSWRDPNSGTIYYNIDKADSSYQTDRINGGAIPKDATYNPSAVYKASVNARLSANAPSENDLLSSNFHPNYLTGNSLAGDPRFTNAQKAMIEANYWAKQAGNTAPYSVDQINSAANGGFIGGMYAPGNARYSYVTPYEEGGQNFISPTMRTDREGNTIMYRGNANEPNLGAYAQGTQTPTDMNYSWERTGGREDLAAGTFQFNPQGAQGAAAQNITARPLTPSAIPSNTTTAGVTVNTPKSGSSNNPDLASAPVVTAGVTPKNGPNGYFDPTTGTFVMPGASDSDRTQAAISYYQQNNMQSNLDAAMRYATAKGFNYSITPQGGSPSAVAPRSYDTSLANEATDGSIQFAEFAQSAKQQGYTPTQTDAMWAANNNSQAGMNDQVAMENLFYQTPEGQQTLQIQKQEEEKMKMQAMLFDDLFANLNATKQEFAQYGAEGQAALAASYQQMLASIDATEQSIMQQIKGQMGADDPQMVAAIGILKDEAKKMAQGLLEEMNTRGVVQSGLYAKAMEDMNSGTMTEIQKMITSRVSDLQNQLNSALVSMAQSRMSMMNTYQTNYANFLSQQQQGLQSLSVAGLNAQVEAAKTQATLSQQDKTNATNLRIAEMNNATSRYSTDQTTSTQKYGYDLSAQTEKYKADLGMGETTAKIVAEMEMQKLDLANRLQVASIGASGSRSGGNNLNDYLKGQEWKLQQINSMKEVVDSMQKDYTNPNKAIYSGRADAIAAINKMGAYGIYDESALAYARDRINTWNPKSTYVIKHGISVPNQKAKTKVNTPQSYAAIDDYSGY